MIQLAWPAVALVLGAGCLWLTSKMITFPKDVLEGMAAKVDDHEKRLASALTEEGAKKLVDRVNVLSKDFQLMKESLIGIRNSAGLRSLVDRQRPYRGPDAPQDSPADDPT